MTTRQHKLHTQVGRPAVQIFVANDRMNQILIEHLDPTAWRAKPHGKPIEVTSGLWNWEKLWKECGSPGGSGSDLRNRLS